MNQQANSNRWSEISNSLHDGFSVDSSAAEARGSTTSFYEADGLGSVTSLTKSNGAIANTYTYDSFGKQTATTGTVVNNFRYTAREIDTETGLMFYRARYYDQNIGRFISEDPARLAGGLNFYDYVENSSTNLVDPSGLCPWQVHRRPLKGVPLAKSFGWDHYYFYNSQTGQSIGLAPVSGTWVGPTPGMWETGEKPSVEVIEVPDWLCNCVDNKTKNPGNPPNFCTFKGKINPGTSCSNCLGWVSNVLQDCYNQEYPKRK